MVAELKMLVHLYWNFAKFRSSFHTSCAKAMDSKKVWFLPINPGSILLYSYY
jgi:hypothetical protein